MPTDPGTRSPGKLGLRYTSATLTHICAARLLHTVDIEGISALRTEATAMANVVKNVLDTAASITGWVVILPDGSIGYEEAFGSAIAGTRTPGANEYRSITMTLSGLGVATGVGAARGKTRFVLFTGAAWTPLAGIKTSPLTIDSALTALANYMHSNLTCFADFYGQHAEPKSYVSWQFNSRAQKHYGN